MLRRLLRRLRLILRPEREKLTMRDNMVVVLSKGGTKETIQ